MAMKINRIELSAYKSANNTIYTGRPQGSAVRAKLFLEQFDKAEDTSVVFVIPENTTSFNPSFYLGLLFKSFEYLGLEEFDKKYNFEIQTDDEQTRKVLLENLDDGKRYAINSINPKAGFTSIFSKRQ